MTNIIEIWKIIEEWPSYSISNFGNVKNNKTNKLKSLRNSGKYYNVVLYTTIKAETYTVHRLVAKHFVENNDIEKNIIVDHIDGNGKNNIYTNLRWCTQSQNMQNKKKTNNICSSIYKGVFYDNGKWKRKKRWNAVIGDDNKQIRIGRYNNEEEAKEAYNNKAIELFGQYVNLN